MLCAGQKEPQGIFQQMLWPCFICPVLHAAQAGHVPGVAIWTEVRETHSLGETACYPPSQFAAFVTNERTLTESQSLLPRNLELLSKRRLNLLSWRTLKTHPTQRQEGNPGVTPHPGNLGLKCCPLCL
jgi:hypothetical protein